MTEKTALAPAEETPLAQVAQRVDANIVEAVITGGDLTRLSPDQRVSYYKAVCESMGLNPLTHPVQLHRGQRRPEALRAGGKLLTNYGASTV